MASSIGVAVGGRATWERRLAEQKPGIHDGLDVPLHPRLPPEVEATRWA